MKVCVVNGSPVAGSLDQYLTSLRRELEGRGATVEELLLRDMDIRYCTGCWGCWVKTPGECVAHDDSSRVCQEVVNSDLVILASPVTMGFVSSLLKRTCDKLIPILHPYMAVVEGEMHHAPRYSRYPDMGLILDAGDDATVEDTELIFDVYGRTALNMKSGLTVATTTDTSAEEVADEIGCHKRVAWGPRSNTRILLGELVSGYDNGATEIHDLTKVQDPKERREIFLGANAVILGFPLYTDAMPGLVMSLIEDLAPLCGHDRMPALGFLVQCGFPETTHIRPVERYLERLAARLGCDYIGTLAKGGCEGIRMQPPRMNRKLFGRLAALGQSLAETGTFDPVLVRQLAGLERMRWYHILLIRMLAPTGLLNFYWNMLLKKNGAYDRRFAAPYAPAA